MFKWRDLSHTNAVEKNRSYLLLRKITWWLSELHFTLQFLPTIHCYFGQCGNRNNQKWDTISISPSSLWTCSTYSIQNILCTWNWQTGLSKLGEKEYTFRVNTTIWSLYAQVAYQGAFYESHYHSDTLFNIGSKN